MPTKKPPTKPINKLVPVKPSEVPVVFNVPVEMPSVYATNIVVQISEFEVVLSFYEAQPSFEADKTNETVRADCVAKVVIARGRYEGVANVMNGILKMAKAQEKKK